MTWNFQGGHTDRLNLDSMICKLIKCISINKYLHTATMVCVCYYSIKKQGASKSREHQKTGTQELQYKRYIEMVANILLASSEDNTCTKLNSPLSYALWLSSRYRIHNLNSGIIILLIAKFLGYASSFFFACLPEAVKELHVLLLGYLKFSMHKKNSMIPNSSNKE